MCVPLKKRQPILWNIVESTIIFWNCGDDNDDDDNDTENDDDDGKDDDYDDDDDESSRHSTTTYSIVAIIFLCYRSQTIYIYIYTYLGELLLDSFQQSWIGCWQDCVGLLGGERQKSSHLGSV